MKEFTTAIREAEATDETYAFKVDGREYTAHAATPAQMAVVLSMMSRHTSTTTKVAGIIDFFMAIMDEADAGTLSERLLDRRDSFDLPEVEAILSWLIEEWSGHPTQEPSGSFTSPTPTGLTLTPTTQESTSSDSPLTASSTSSSTGTSPESPKMTMISP